jgi:hypothetical protein
MRRLLLVGGMLALLGALGAWLWPIGLTEQRLGQFVFQGPSGLQTLPEGHLESEDFHVGLLTKEPSWVTCTGIIEVDGYAGFLERTSPFAPVVGGDPRATDVRDRGIRMWFPDLGRGLFISWRTYGGPTYWLRDTRLDQSSTALIASLRIEP